MTERSDDWIKTRSRIAEVTGADGPAAIMQLTLADSPGYLVDTLAMRQALSRLGVMAQGDGVPEEHQPFLASVEGAVEKVKAAVEELLDAEASMVTQLRDCECDTCVERAAAARVQEQRDSAQWN